MLIPTIAQQVAEAATRFQERRTGHAPQSATVVLIADTLVVTLHGALSQAESALAKTPEGAAQVREFHRLLFAGDSDALRREIKRITGVAVREATAEIEPTSGAIVHAFTTGAIVQIFLMDAHCPTQTWSEAQPEETRKPNEATTEVIPTSA